MVLELDHLSLSRRRFHLAALAALGAAGLAGGEAGPAQAAGGRTIRIGYQRYGTLIILKHLGLLEAEPIFAQAARPDGLVYVGHEPKAPFGEAIVVAKDSPIRTVADLKGRSVALNKGSNVHWLLLAALAKAGLQASDIHPIYLVPAAGRSAFDTSRVDAWAIWDPYLSSVETMSGARVLVSADGVVGNRQFFLARRAFADAQPDLIRLLQAQLAQSDSWGDTHKDKVASMLAADTGLPVPVVARAVGRLTFGIKPLGPDVVAEQQAIADAFAAQGLIPGHVTVENAVWHPPA